MTYSPDSVPPNPFPAPQWSSRPPASTHNEEPWPWPEARRVGVGPVDTDDEGLPTICAPSGSLHTQFTGRVRPDVTDEGFYSLAMEFHDLEGGPRFLLRIEGDGGDTHLYVHPLRRPIGNSDHDWIDLFRLHDPLDELLAMTTTLPGPSGPGQHDPNLEES